MLGLSRSWSSTASVRRRLVAALGSALLILSLLPAGSPVLAAGPLSITNVDSPDPVQSGAQLLYTITITNTGGAKVSNTVLTDQINGVVGFGNPPLLDVVSSRGTCTQNSTQVTCNGGIIEGGGVWTVTVRGIVTAPSGTTINNIATVVATKSAQTYTTSAAATTQVQGSGPGGPSPDLTIGKNGPLAVTPGGTVTYTLTVNNLGSANATNVKVTDTVPTGVAISGVTATSLFACGIAGQTVTCMGGRVNAGSNATITINGTAPAAPASLENTSVVDPDNTIDEGILGNTADAAELNNFSNTVITDVSPIPPPPPGPITIDNVGPASAMPGELIDYTATITNGNLGRADYITVTIGTQGLHAASLAVISATSTSGTTPECVVAAPTVTCTMTRLATGGVMAIHIRGMVVASAGSTIINSAAVNANIKNTGYTASDEVQTIINPGIDLTITKTDSPDPVCASSFPGMGSADCKGGLSYTFVVGNSGVNPANNVVVRDPLPPGTTYDDAASSALCDENPPGIVICTIPVLAAGATMSITIVLTAPATTGTITNTVTVDPSNAILEADETNNIAVESTTVSTGIDLTIKKDDSPPGSPNGFDPIATSGTQTYRITVDNTGTQNATGILVRDTLPAGTIFLSAEEIDLNGTGTFPDLHGFTCTHNGAPTGGVVDCVGGSLLGTASEFYFPPAPGDDKATIEIKVFARPTIGVMHNEVRVDPLNTIAEYDENDNIEFEDTQVVNGGGGMGAFNELAITKSSNPASLSTSTPVTYTIVVTNDGTDPAVNVLVRDTLPAGFVYISAADSAPGPLAFHCLPVAGNAVECNGATIVGGGGLRTITITAFTSSIPGVYTNQAIVDPSNAIPEGNETNNFASAQTTVVVGAGYIDLSLTKCDQPVPADPSVPCTTDSDPAVPSGNVTYILTATNNGTNPAFNVKVTDTLPAGTTFVSAADMAPGNGAFTCTFASGVISCTGATIDGSLNLIPDPAIGTSRMIEVILLAPAAKGPITNQAAIDPDGAIAESNETNNSAVQTTVVAPKINLTLEKTGPDQAHQNDVTDYVITVHNEAVYGGGETAFGVHVHDALPIGLIPLSVSTDKSNMICQILENPVNVVDCVGDMSAPNANPDSSTVVITITVFVTAEKGPLDNEACVDPTDPTHPNGLIIEFDEGDNCKTKTTTVLALSPDLLVNKSADATVVTPGQTFSYLVSLSNIGDATALGPITITDKLDVTKVDFVAASGINGYNTCTFVSPNVTCSGPGLAPGEFTQITIQVKVKNGVTTPILNEASVPEDTAFDPAAAECTGSPSPCENEGAANTSSTNANNKDSVTVSVGGSGIDLVMLSLDDNVDPTAPGGVVTYTATVKNQGTADATGAKVRIILPNTGLNHITSGGSNGFSCSFLFPNIDCTGNLPSGGSTVITVVTQVTATAPPDASVTVAAKADPDDAIDESDETNNDKTQVTTVHATCATACIDLVMSPIVASPSVVHVDEYAQFIVGVGNAGDTNTGTFDITLKLDDTADFDFAPGGFDDGQPSDDYSATADFDCTMGFSSDTVTCTGDLDGGEGVLIILKVHVKAATHPFLNLEAKADPDGDITSPAEESVLNNNANASVGLAP